MEKSVRTDKIAIVHDSASSLPDKYRTGYEGLVEVPFKLNTVVNGQDKSWLDTPFKSDEERKEFLYHLTEGQVLTSQPIPDDYQTVFENIIKTGVTEIAVIPMSQGMSGSMNSAEQAAEKLKDMANISVADIKTVSMAQGLLVTQADIENKRGEFESAAELVQRVNELSKRVFAVQAFSNLEHLRRGGRIGLVGSVVGGAFNIIPIVGVNEDGVLKTFEKKRGWNKARNGMIDYVSRNVGEKAVRLAIVHFEPDPFELQALSEAVDIKGFNIAIEESYPDGTEKKYERLEGEEHMVLATHSGPGVVGLGALIVEK